MVGDKKLARFGRGWGCESKRGGGGTDFYVLPTIVTTSEFKPATIIFSSN